jgi:hypothetical protein
LAVRMIGAVIVLLMIAGTIEGFVSTSEGGVALRVGVSTVSALFLLLYLANGVLWLRSQGRRDAELGTIRPAESSAS